MPLSGWLFDDEFAEQLAFEAELEERQETLPGEDQVQGGRVRGACRDLTAMREATWR